MKQKKRKRNRKPQRSFFSLQELLPAGQVRKLRKLKGDDEEWKTTNI